MAYASVQDWLDRNSHRKHVADFNRDGEADTAAVERALEDATAEIDGWLAKRYTTPVADPLAAPILRQHCLVIETHLLADAPTVRDEEISSRHKASMDFLKSVAKGQAGLPMTVSVSSAGKSSNVGVTFVTPERMFS
ncbi:phage protein Gp36 family protein [Pseudovibrio sp. Tun.PSC04-5.I4]|uniref:phage protein Gp36 family protein n=1 Tax=Pseudovibrio sp. Tun.PSC04-5.I4 TaxID=1798213 RepID=UPI000882AB93|nr:phage protein Gp36 family protein [Pseudovibrio sp. Tun.PSC04-5.I4]SDR07656.1 Mu-like prophage protein gp36 [Pseudovibrio sp. Tun.PSC04-5.I4]